MNRDDLEVLTVDHYVRLLGVNVPFAQANYGDGEWACLLGAQGGNVNGEKYDPVLARALRKTLQHPRSYLYGTNPGGRWESSAEGFLARNAIEDVPWVWKDTLSGANVRGEIGPVFRALRDRRILAVGPSWLKDVPAELVELPFIFKVHASKAWTQRDKVAEWVRSIWETDDVVLFSAGMGSNLMIYDLWPEAEKKGIALLDVGAIFDPFTGRYTRKHYKRLAWRTIAQPRIIAESQGLPSTVYPTRAYWNARAHDFGPSYVGPGSDPAKSHAEGERLKAALGEYLSGRRFGFLLDFGCGSGRLSAFLSRYTNTYVGVDLSETGVRQAKQNGVDAIHLPDDHLPFEDASFDGATVVLVFQHIPPGEFEAWAAEIRRVLEPGAVMVVVDEMRREGVEYQPHVHPRSPWDVAEALGLKVWTSGFTETGHWIALLSEEELHG